MLNRHAGVDSLDQDVFVNAVGGVRISEPAADLAVLLAIQSSLRGRALPAGFLAFGEVGLAGQAPVGQVDSAVMLNAKLRTGLPLIDIPPLTRSLGQERGDDPETFAWTDASGASVTVELVGRRCTRRRLERPPSTAA